MRTDKQWLNYQELELISSQAPQSSPRVLSVRAAIKRIWTALVVAITADSQLHISQTIDRQGNRHWLIYDPRNGQSIQFSSEAEVRAWIDTRLIRGSQLPVRPTFPNLVYSRHWLP